LGFSNSLTEFWSVASRFVSNGWFVATFVNVDALVVTKVFTAASLEHHTESPFLNIASLSEVLDVWVGCIIDTKFISRACIAGNGILSVDEFVDITFLNGSVGREVGCSDHRVLLHEASEEFVFYVSETFYIPFDHINIESVVVATSGG
jgi:hypothetical protein